MFKFLFLNQWRQPGLFKSSKILRLFTTNSFSNNLNLQIKTSLSDPKTLKNPNGVLDLIKTALNSDVELSVSDYITGINAAADTKGVQCDISFRLYDLYKEKCVVPIECYTKLFKICSNRDNAERALSLHHDYMKYGHQVSENILNCLILILAKTVRNENCESIQTHYQQLKDIQLAQPNAVKIKSTIYIQVATFHCRLNKSELALSALEDMTQADLEPTSMLCAPLLDSALFVSDAKVLRVLASWYVDNFNETLERGVINRILQAAAIAGDGLLAQLAFRMIDKNSYTPTSENFSCMIRSCLLSGDIVSAVEALQIMELRGVRFSGSGSDEDELYQVQVLRESMVTALCRSGDTVQLDELYYALKDQADGGGSVPKLALDAIVEASGRLDLNDRAFATFKEYQTVFRMTPDIHSHNALLASCGCARSVMMHTMLSIFETIDQSCVPNEQSYSLLLEAMVDSGDFRVFDDVLSFMKESGVSANARVLRRVIISCVKRCEEERVMQLTELLQNQEGRPISRHLRSRISQVRFSLAKK